MTEMIYYYDGSFEGFLCCIFDSYAYKEVLTAIYRDEDALPTLFASRTIQTNQEHANHVLRRVVKSSAYAAELLHKGYLTCLPDKEIHLYRMVVRLLKEGGKFLGNPSDETMYPILKAVRHLNGEAHLLKGFVRFSELGGILGSEIEPKNRVLPLLRSHFCSRYRDEGFFIYDRTHREALFYAGGKAVIQPLDFFQMAPPDEAEARYRTLWKRFYDTIAIKERHNPKCRMTQMPKRYWNTMTEFQDESYFKPQNFFEAVPDSDVPTGISAPVKPQESWPSVLESSP